MSARGRRLAGPTRDERGLTVSVFVLLVLAALVATAGLVVDGGQKVTAASRAEAAADGAARAAGNAAATQRLAGRDGAGAGGARGEGLPRRGARRHRFGQPRRGRRPGRDVGDRAHDLPVGRSGSTPSRGPARPRPASSRPARSGDAGEHRRRTGQRRTTRRAAPARPGADGAPTLPVPPRLPGRRNPRWIALGVIAICLGGLLAYAVYARVSTETRVLTVASTVYRGEVVDAADLTTVVVHGDPPGPVVRATDQSSVVGKRAVFDLPAGSLVAPGSLADAALPDTGRSVVGLRLATGRAPASLLVPSAPVRIVALPAPANGTGREGRAGRQDVRRPRRRLHPGRRRDLDGRRRRGRRRPGADDRLARGAGPDRAGPGRGAVTAWPSCC